MKVALSHDWLIHMRGGEKVLESLAEIYPDATIYTLFYNRDRLSPSLQRMKIKSSFLQRLPGIQNYYRWLLPILPWVIKTIRVEPADLVISSSHCVAKGMSIPADAYHICYCHTPMRYLWGFEDIYFEKFPFWIRPVLRWILSGLRRWDLESNKKVDYFVANSENVRKRIEQFYSREAVVIYPPLDREFFHPAGEPKEYYLVVSAFVPYKRVDLVIEAFNKMKKKLLIVGSGPMDAFYRRLRRNDQIFFLGALSGSELRSVYSQAKALIFPTDEDFGIVPLEAQACATPVIAYEKGGALESVRTGIFFAEQTPEAICRAVAEFEAMNFVRAAIPAKVKKFDKECFKEQFKKVVLENFPAEVYAAQ